VHSVRRLRSRASRIQRMNSPTIPAFHSVTPDLETYRGWGYRRMDAQTYDAKCMSCIWRFQIPVEMIIDQLHPAKKQYRFETLCYGPKSYPFYRPRPARKVPGRKGMSCTEEDWVDEDATAHRGPDDRGLRNLRLDLRHLSLVR